MTITECSDLDMNVIHIPVVVMYDPTPSILIGATVTVMTSLGCTTTCTLVVEVITEIRVSLLRVILTL